MKHFPRASAFLLASLLGAAAWAQSGAPASEGEVRKIDKATAKITLKHGEIRNLDMPPMTMVFVAKDATLLDKVKVGDKVKFSADKDNGQYVVTAIEPQR